MSGNFDVLHGEAVHHEEVLPVFALPASEAYAPAGHRASVAVDEEITKLVQRLFLLPAKQPAPMAVTFCGVAPNVGCTWICARAAAVLAEHVSGRVCVVDANFRNPSLHEHFHLDCRSGLADAIRDTRPVIDFVQPTYAGNLFLLSAGKIGSESSAAFNSSRLCIRLAELRQQFDYLVVDSPSLSSYTDAAVLGLLTDGLVLVLASNLTRREPARRVKEELDAAKVPILGAVLNRRTYPIPEALYRIL